MPANKTRIIHYVFALRVRRYRIDVRYDSAIHFMRLMMGLAWSFFAVFGLLSFTCCAAVVVVALWAFYVSPVLSDRRERRRAIEEVIADPRSIRGAHGATP
jgi:Ca2+/Na+ antiporter